LAFLYFKEQNVDYVVLETGLGGRLDATNIVTPIMSIITSISLEHTEILGTTLEEITKEKAGIIKAHIPVVVGPKVPLKPIEEITKTLNSPLLIVSEKFSHFNEENNAIAKKALEWMKISNSSIEKGLKELPPCRLQIVKDKPLIILDVAHNPDGLKSLFATLKDRYPDKSLSILFGLSKSKDIPACLKIIKQHGTSFHLIESSNGRNIEKHVLKEMMLKEDIDLESIFFKSSTQETVVASVEHALKNDHILVVCGSFFIMAYVRAHLNLNEPRDIFDMNER
jgi:dihydrofolate synthase/folylpolyglutamate synthase